MKGANSFLTEVTDYTFKKSLETLSATLFKIRMYVYKLVYTT